MRLDGEIAVVFGAAGAVGRAVVEAFIAEGAIVAAADLRIGPNQLGALAVEVDATDSIAVNKFAEAVERKLGPATVLVNCQGHFDVSPYEDISDDAWHRIVECNLTSIFVTTRAFAPSMQRQKRGAMVNIASTAGEYGSIRPAAHYAAAKGGVIAFSKSLARELAPDRVRVNVVSPGPLDTPMLGAITAEAKQAMAERCPLGRLGVPDDVAKAVVYLASSDASWVTGDVLRVNGGSLI
jgi:NAD(P)-dependent dehydrogenase (short-subunit alcohol dehydrogenase family)